MSKKRHTAESRMKPGSASNLSVAAFGDQAGPNFERLRHFVFAWLNAGDAEVLARKLPEYAKKVARNHKKLAADTLQLIVDAITNNRPEDLRKLADIIARTHEVKSVDATGNVSFAAASPDAYKVLVHHFMTLQKEPAHKFTIREWRRVVGNLSEKEATQANQALDQRIYRILDKIGIKRSSQ